MKKTNILVAVVASLLALAGCSPKCNDATVVDPVDLVNPMTGTGFHGHTYPGATVPYGLVQLSPDTRTSGWDACGGYHYDDGAILGFAHTHLNGTGCADLSDFLFTPLCGQWQEDETGYVRLPFSHKDETAEPGYYSVLFPEMGIKAEMTASAHTGVHRYTFAKEGPKQIRIDMRHAVTEMTFHQLGISQTGPNEVDGFRVVSAWVQDRHIHFSAAFSVPIVSFTEPKNGVAVVTLPEDTKEVTIVVGLSGVSVEGARANRLAEVPECDFDAVRAAAHEAWEQSLSKIEIKGGTELQRRTFYTSLYHTQICPNNMADVSGQYRASDGSIKTLPAGRDAWYSTLSLWDTYRAWAPLQMLIDQKMTSDLVYSMLDFYDGHGELPLWALGSGETHTMIGYHSAPIISAAWQGGVRDFDAQHALEALVRSSNINKKSADLNNQYGYIPTDLTREAVSRTLEFCYDDWCVAQFAQSIGAEDVAQEYYERGERWHNILESGSLFFRGRRSDGTWATPFDPLSTTRDYTEGIPWQYRFGVPHDIRGLMQEYGSRESFISALDSLFTYSERGSADISDMTGFVGQYAHGNEPSHAMAFIYDYIGQPHKSQQYVRQILDEMYAPTPEGVCGNEDCGQMSAWYCLASCGLYQPCPGTGEWVLCAPLFSEVNINLASGKVLTVRANAGKDQKYIESVSLNGETLSSVFLTQETLMQGGVLEFKLSSKPITKGEEALAVPYSYSDTKSTTQVSTPYYISQDPFMFTGSLSMQLCTRTEGASIKYSIDGAEALDYTEPLNIDRTCTISAWAVKDGMEPSDHLTFKATRAMPHAASVVADPQPGLLYHYAEGPFTKTADVLAVCPETLTRVMPKPDISGARLEDHFGYVFKGYLDIPESGIWGFEVMSDDGSVLYIDGDIVVNNDGGHMALATNGPIMLEAGLHPFTLVYFEDYEGQALAWRWKSPSSSRYKSIPTDNIKH